MSFRSLVVLNRPTHLFHDALTNSDSIPFTKKTSSIYGLSLHAAPTKIFAYKASSTCQHFYRKDSTAEAWSICGDRTPHRELHRYLAPRLGDCVARKVRPNLRAHPRDFCPWCTDDTSVATKRRSALGEVIEEAKAMLEGDVKTKLQQLGLKVE